MQVVKLLEQILININKENVISILRDFGYDTEIEEKIISTTYNDYGGYGTDNFIVISKDDYIDFINDLISEFINALPDKFDRYVNKNELLNDAINNFSVIVQLQDFLHREIRVVDYIIDRDLCILDLRNKNEY